MLNGPGYVTTGPDGSFSITGDYTCQPGDLVYLLATGGNPGLAAGTNNTKLALETALGPCSALTSDTVVQINEVTTVAAAYALNEFQFDGRNLASTSSTQGRLGLTNAFAMANVLVNTATGLAPAEVPSASTVVPQAKINTLANAIASCVNSDGTGAACANLFAATTYGFAPSDTLGAMLQLAFRPYLSPAPVFALSTATAPFQPSLTSAPNDWTLGVLFGGGQFYATHVAIDGYGNAWFVRGNGGGSGGVYEVSPTGSVLSPAGGFSGGAIVSPQALSIDDSSNVWIADSSYAGSPNLSELDRFGNPLSPATGFPGQHTISFLTLAVDGTGAVWGATSTNTPAQKFDSSGNLLTGPSPDYTASSFYQLVALPGNYMLGMSGYATSLKEFSPLGVVTGTVTLEANARYLAVDHAGNIWVADQQALTKYASTGARLSPTAGYTGGGISGPNAITVDGAGTVWIANSGVTTAVNAVACFSNYGTALSPSTGYQSDHLKVPLDVAVDPSGNVWVVSGGGGGGVVVLVGAGSPTVTPFATGVKNGTLATAP